MTRELEPPTRNSSGSARGVERQRALRVLRLPLRAGDRGRIGDVQLGNLSAHASKTWTVATISRTSLWCACPDVPSHTPTYYHRKLPLESSYLTAWCRGFGDRCA